MAVQIPVVVDIDKAFDEAAKRVATAIKPLQRAIDVNTASVKLKFGEEYDANLGQMVNKYETLEKLINSVQTNQRTGASKMKYSVEEWSTALEFAKKQLSDLNALQATGRSVDPNRLSALRESISVLTVAIEQRRHEADLIERTTQKQIAATRAIEAGNYALIQEASTISQISDKISSLRGKLENLDPSKNKKEWNATAKEIEKATAQLRKYEQMLTATTKPGSIDRMRAEMQKLEQQWNSMSKRQKFDADGNLTASAQKVVNKFRDLTVESEKYGQSLAQTAGKAKPSIDSTTNALRTQSSVLRSLTSYASMYVSVFGLLRFVKQIRDVTAELEYQRVALGHLIQDEEYGAKLFEKIKALAVESPFRITQLVTYTKQLAAYRIEQENLFDTTKRLADISAGLGVDMNRLILAYGQVRAASVLRGQELRQFTEAGIPLVELLAEKFQELGREGTTTADVFKLISERAVPFSMIAEIFEDLTDKGGMFYKMQEEQAKTLKGRWEKLKDAYDIALQSIGNTKTFENWNNAILKTLRFLADNIRVVPKILEALTRGWIAYNAAVIISNLNTKKAISYEVALAASQKTDATRIGRLTVMVLGEAKARDLLTKAYARQAIATTALSRTFWKLTAAMIANPIGALVAGVAALTGLFFTFRKNVDNTANSLDYLDNAIENIANETKIAEKSSKLIEKYEKLASNTSRTAKENEKLHTTIEQLRDIFPELAASIDDENLSLEDQVKLLKEARSEREKQARLEAEGSYETAKKDLEESLKREKDLEKQYRTALQQQRNYEELGLKVSEKTWRKKAEKIKEQLDATRESTQKFYSSIASFEKYLFPEKVTERLSEWQKLLIEARKYTSEGVNKEIFSENDVEGWESLGDAIKKLKPQFKEAKETYEGLVNAVKGGGRLVRPQLIKDRDAAKDTYDAWMALDALLGGLLSSATSGGGSHQTDPWITNMQERIKFMKDFKKGYDDLKKYMSSTSALMEESNIMLGRGKSLGLSAADQERAAENLSDWYEDMIKATSDRLRSKGLAGATVTDLLGIDTTKRSKDIQELQRLLQSLWDAKTDFDISQKKKDFEDALKRLSDEIKRSETARNFYKNILDLTGDEDLAATMGISVYGDIGSEFKDRLQKQLHAALSEFDDKGDFALWDKMREALGSGDFNTILKYLDRFPDEWQKRLKEMAEADEKYNADLVQNLMKTLAKSKTYGDKQVEIAKKSAERIAEINSLSVPQAVKDDLLKQNAKKEAEETARVQYEAFKESPMYIELFENLEGASTRMLTNMRENLQSLKGEWKNLSPRELRELQNKLDELDKQLATRNPFRAMVDSWKEYIALTKQQSRADADETAAGLTRYANLQKELLEAAKRNYEEIKNKKDATAEEIAAAKDELDVQAEETDLAIEQAEAAQETANKYRLAAKHIQDAADGMKEWAGYITDALGGVGEIIETFASDDTADTFNIISQGLSKTMNGLATTAGSVGRLLAGDLTAIPSLIQGVGEVIGGIFGTRQKLKIKQIDKEIKYQQDLLDDLTYSYDRLEKAIAKSFGSDYIYNYNKQLENLNAQIEAYNAQADLERGKGKKADAEKIKEYENNARDAQDQVAEMGSQLSEFFAGTDLTSAAKNFATSWIDAYKEFGNTTDAMKERFQDMIQSMIVNSLAARIVEEQLGPIFDMIDRLSQDDGILSAKDIAEIAAATDAILPNLNSGLTGLMNSLTSLGYNLRQGVGGLTGISRDIAGASEESITGLAAGINTQNFYMSLISQNVAAILAAMTGETVEGATGATVPDPYKEQVLTYMGSLPQMRDDMYAIRTLLERVIKPLGTNATHYVATRM